LVRPLAGLTGKKVWPMQPDEPGSQLPPGFSAATGWQAMVFVGVVAVILGLIVALHPGGSLNVIAVLLGVLLVISGIFDLVRVFDSSEPHRVWLGIAGLLLVVIGVVLIRHLDLTVALVGLVIGISWIVQGLAALVTAFSGGPGEQRGWWIFFGLIGLVAGIVVVAVPTTSVTVLAVLVGIWFIVTGLVEIVGGFMQRHADSKSQAGPSQPASSW
jgi:uncharacterized membrane protein HdeD (DUF308 family)